MSDRLNPLLRMLQVRIVTSVRFFFKPYGDNSLYEGYVTGGEFTPRSHYKAKCNLN
jgi:hypothetical protein